MIHFAVGLYNSLFSVPEYRILIIGDGNSGKSVLMEQLKYMYHPNNTSTGEATTAAVSAGPSPTRSEGREAGATASCSSSSADGLEALRTVLKNSKEKAEAHNTNDNNGTDGNEAIGSEPLVAAVPASRKAPLPAGTPLPAPPSYIAAKRIRPTVGMNYAHIEHRYCPLPNGAPGSSSGTPPSPTPPSGRRSSLVMWDLGGERALRSLWENYYPQCQAIIYVVDSCLYHDETAATEMPSPRRGEAPKSRLSSGPGEARPRSGGERCPSSARRSSASTTPDPFDIARIKSVYAENARTLESLLLHPQLRNVPILVLSNKVDLPHHVPLAEMQVALDVAGLAVKSSFYAGTAAAAAQGDTNSSSTTTTTTAVAEGKTIDAKKAVPSAAGGAASDGGSVIGTSGFGRVVMRLAEVSALDGTGLAVALDWLVAQLERGAREVEREEGK